MAILTIMIGDQIGTTFDLASRPLSLGRAPSRDIQITDPKVSRKHAVIRPVDGHHAITPTKATNDILINGQPIHSETVFQDGDELTLGDTVARFSTGHAADATNAVHHRKIADAQARDARTMM